MQSNQSVLKHTFLSQSEKNSELKGPASPNKKQDLTPDVDDDSEYLAAKKSVVSSSSINLNNLDMNILAKVPAVNIERVQEI